MADSEKYMDANWKFVKIEGGGHWLPIDEAAQLFKLADDWFQKQSQHQYHRLTMNYKLGVLREIQKVKFIHKF